MPFKQYLLTAICCFYLCCGTVYANGTKLPALMEQVMQQDPVWSKAFGEASALMKSRQWSDANQSWQNFFEKTKTQYGENHIATAIAAFKLGDSYLELKKFAEAQKFLERSAEGFERLVGADSSTVIILNKLAAIHKDLIQYDKALPFQQRALAIHEKILGSEHPDTAHSLNNIGVTFNDFGQHDKALPLLERALAINEKFWGLDHPVTAISMINLAATYSRFGQHDKALHLQQRALAIHENILGSEHPVTAISLSAKSEQ